MTQPTPRGRTLRRLLLAAVLSLSVLSWPVSTGAATAYTLDLSRPDDYVNQKTFSQCVGASMQMMINMIAPKDDRTVKGQSRLQVMARALSGRRPEGNERRGASVRGWSAGLNMLGAGPYRLVGKDSLDDALLTAARAMRETGRPVGLLVWRGRHAWGMGGFRATADPLTDPRARVTGAVILDPLYPYGSSVWGPSPKPRELLTVDEVGEQFVPRRRRSNSNPNNPPGVQTMSALNGKYVLVLPYDSAPVGRTTLAAS